MKILVAGSGGREHALCWRLSADPEVSAIVAAPGNPGIAEHAVLAAVDPGDPDAPPTRRSLASIRRTRMRSSRSRYATRSI